MGRSKNHIISSNTMYSLQITVNCLSVLLVVLVLVVFLKDATETSFERVFMLIGRAREDLAKEWQSVPREERKKIKNQIIIKETYRIY